MTFWNSKIAISYNNNYFLIGFLDSYFQCAVQQKKVTAQQGNFFFSPPQKKKML